MKKYFQRNAGFTLIEVLIVIIILMILLTGMIKVLTACLVICRTCESKFEAQETARFAVDSMVRELKYAKKIKIINPKILSIESDVKGLEERIYYSLDENHVIKRIEEKESVPQPLTSPIISKLEFTSSSREVNTIFIVLTAAIIDKHVNPPKLYEYTIETAVSKLNK